MRISAAITTHQRRHLVLDAIGSAIAQKRSPDEIIVVDNGSTDGTGELVDQAFGRAVRLVRQDQLGLPAARNNAAAHADGDLIAFLDDDDRWLPHHLATVEALAHRHPAAVLISTCHNAWFGAQSVSDSLAIDMVEPLLLGTDWVGPPSGVAVSREAYLAVGGCDERLDFAEDFDLFLRLSLLGPTALISATTFSRRVEPDSKYELGLREKLPWAAAQRILLKFLDSLDTTERADADALRRAATERLAMEATVAALAGGARIPISPKLVEELQKRTIGKLRA
jgi:glycosyltransferase involved in cell wall biosynthesis